MYHFQLCIALLLANLKLAFLQDLKDYGILRCGGTKGFLEVGVRGDGPFRDVCEDLVDLKDFVEVGFAG